jgi:prolipoprotein diacylglyceryl transferase
VATLVGAFLPSPMHSVWHLGPLPVRAYALCLVAGIVLAVWLTDLRYRRAGGPVGMILDVAVWAVPAGLIGARLYSVITDYQLYFGRGGDWVHALRVWDGALGIPGAIAGGALGAWAVCRRGKISLGPIAGAAAPALAFGLAVGAWANWFSQQQYGRPSAMAIAVEIAPAHRVPGYENYATFQPLFLYESLWCVLAGLLALWAARRFALSGDRVFALFVATYAAGKFATESLRIDPAHHFLGLRVNQWVLGLAFGWAVGYLLLTRRDADAAAGPAARPVAAAPRSADGGPAAGVSVPGQQRPDTPVA